MLAPVSHNMSEYRAFFKNVSDLTASEREDMASLYLRYFDGSDDARVKADLEAKTEVLLVLYKDVLIGFTTLQLYDIQWQERPVQIVYSGDTIVDQAHWGQQALAFAWIDRLGQLHRARPDIPMYWFVIVKGHRTYKFLPTFGKSFYPHWEIDRSDLKPLLDHLALQKFGEYYSAETGLISFPESRGHLKAELALPTDEEKKKDVVRFFMQRNPGYVFGHELACLCEISEQNMKPLTKRIFNKGAQ